MPDYYEKYWRDKLTDQLNDFDYKWPAVKRVFPLKKGLKVLDYGCGSGKLLAELIKARPGNTFIGADVSITGLQRAGKNLPNIRFFQVKDGDKLPFASREFDVVVALDVVEHVYDTDKLLAELVRVLKTSGKLIVTTPYHGLVKNLAIVLLGFEKVFNPKGPHIRFFTDKSLRESLEGAGFEVEYVAHFGRFFPLSRGVLMVAKK